MVTEIKEVDKLISLKMMSRLSLSSEVNRFEDSTQRFEASRISNGHRVEYSMDITQRRFNWDVFRQSGI